MSAPTIGNPDFLRTGDYVTSVLYSNFLHAGGSNSTPVLDVRGYETLVFNTGFAGGNFAEGLLTWYADAAGASPVIIESIVTNDVGPSQFARSVRGPYFAFSIAQVPTFAVPSLAATIIGTNASASPRELFGSALLFPTAAQAVGAGPASVTLQAGAQLDGKCNIAVASTSPTWTSTLQYLDITGTFQVLAAFRATDGTPRRQLVSVPTAPLQLVFNNTDPGAQTFQVFAVMGD